MAGVKPQVLILQLGDEYQKSLLDSMYSGLLSKMAAKYTITRTASLSGAHLSQSKAVLVSDGGLAQRKHRSVQIQLSVYAKAGGTVLLTCQFCSFVTTPEFSTMCRNMGLRWKTGDYHRTNFVVNPICKATFGVAIFNTLEKAYSMKANHLKNVRAEARLYVPTDESRVESSVLPARKVDTRQCAAALQKHGEGFIGYTGDVNNESGSEALLMALLRMFKVFCDSPSDEPLLILDKAKPWITI